MTAAVSISGGLDAKTRDLRALLRKGPEEAKRAARAVVTLADSWGLYRHEAGDLDFGPWLRSRISKGKSEADYRRIVEAEDTCGRVSRFLSAESVVWVAGKLGPSATSSSAFGSLHAAYKANHEQPLSRVQVARIFKEHVDHPADRKDETIRKLREQIEAAGMTPCA